LTLVNAYFRREIMRNLILKFLKLDKVHIEMLVLKSETNLLLRKIGSLADDIEKLRKEFDELS